MFLGAVGVLVLAASVLVLRETLPVERRVTGGMSRTGRDMLRLLRDRPFVGAVLVTGFANAALFAYLSGATFLLQDVYGLSPQGYSYSFGLNSFGFMVFGFLAGRASERWSEYGTVITGLVMCAVGAGGLLAAVALHLPLVAVILSLLTMVGGVAVTTPPATSLALAGYPDMAGTASSFLGVARFAFGGLAAPLVGLGGGAGSVSFGVVTVACTALAASAYALALRRSGSHPRPPVPSTVEPEIRAAVEHLVH